MQLRLDRAYYIEDELNLVSFNTNPPSPNRTTNDFFPLYESLRYRSWFTVYPRLDELPIEERAVD